MWVSEQTLRLYACVKKIFGQALSAGGHYLIVKRILNTISVRQQMGSDTSLTLPLPTGWQTSDPIEAWAYNLTGEKIAQLTLTIDAGGLTFTWHANVASQEVEQFSLP